MSVVTLVSGGLDSTLMAKLAQEEGIKQFPLFVDYGQRARAREWKAAESAMRGFGLPRPEVADVHGYGSLIRSGLTDTSKHVLRDAFTPGRNLLFLLIASAHAVQVDAQAVAIGLLHEEQSLFPDQTVRFVEKAEEMLEVCMGVRITVLTPLASFRKAEVVRLAQARGIEGTYSCHLGLESPCGRCIACKEYEIEEAQNGRS